VSILTSFGRPDFGNQAELREWQIAHDFRHRTERAALSRLGISLSPVDLRGDFESTWFGRHYMNHLALNQAIAKKLKQTPPPQTVALIDPWKDEQSFYNWHRAHNVIHQHTDSQLGINSNQGT
jgi:hypothetical protein